MEISAEIGGAREMAIQTKFYGSSYYASDNLDPESRSPRVVVPLITSILKPRSVVDVGCGIGGWLFAFRENGIERIQGLDGEYIDPNWLVIPPECFRALDLSKPFRLDEQYDLAVCLEVAEHLPKGSAQQFIASLVRLAPFILFSAAIPLQGGIHHLNEQWPEYWQGLFREHGYQKLDLIRKHIWKNPDVKYWYRQNIFLYVRDDLAQSRPEFVEATQFADDLLLVHPEILQRQLGVRPTLKALPSRIWKAARSRIRALMTQD
jgi:SAM-dependent methyltransferase